MITLSESWLKKVPGARVGLLFLSKAPNQPGHPALDDACRDLERELGDQYGGMDRKSLRELPVFAAYDSFYRDFRKTYHVQLQLESVVFRGKPIRYPSALVGCLFLAELETGLLTAGHDHDALKLPLVADVARGEESYLRLGCSGQQLKEGDLYIRDQEGVLSSVIYGPDHRTRIRKDTSRVVYTTYGPPGISEERIRDQLVLLEEYVRLFAPATERMDLLVL